MKNQEMIKKTSVQILSPVRRSTKQDATWPGKVPNLIKWF